MVMAIGFDPNVILSFIPMITVYIYFNMNNGDLKKWRHWIIPLDSKKGTIVSMCLNENGEQLLAITDKSIIYLIPFFFKTYWDGSINRYRTVIEKDASLRTNCSRMIENPTAIVWWQRDERYVQQRSSIAIIGTRSGQISMIDLDQDHVNRGNNIN
ncbi:hypothetical protein BLA29_010285 [Euroglyphus maynei]|uniref:Uncharacterized protein n=1 Tax=Euroglyphus maynei TaxID=6958 RepID=A0A1Y3BQ60_EURMA|nr:hypothetical protein BLA29_010285 [Euroglyphus maynei]